jgi:hypothetical protein
MQHRAPRRVPAIPGLAALALFAALAACTALPPKATAPGPVLGEGPVATEDRTGGDFEHLSVGAGITVTITTGSPTSVTLAAQENLLPRVVTDIVDGQLIVNIASPGISTMQPITLTVVAPELRSVTLSSGAAGTIEVAGTDLAIDVSGGAQLHATGRTGTLRLTASSGAQADLGGLVADTAVVALSGGCQANLNVVNELTGTASGGSTINLEMRRPASVQVTTSGGAIVQGG